MSERRAFVGQALAAAAVLAAGPPVRAAELKSAADALDTIERLDAAVVARLTALGLLPVARVFCQKLLAEHERLRAERARLRTRLRLTRTPPTAATPADARSLAALREAQNALMLAHAEGLPALPDPSAVDLLARHAIAASRHLTLIDLWIEAEEARG